eukprot:11196954-Lingulodinium_polyedra.AAC.1
MQFGVDRIMRFAAQAEPNKREGRAFGGAWRRVLYFCALVRCSLRLRWAVRPIFDAILRRVPRRLW